MLLKHVNVLITVLLPILIPKIMCDFAPLANEEISEPLSAFIATSLQIHSDKKMVLPLYTTKLDREQIISHLYEMAIMLITNAGSPDPKSFGNIVLQTYEYYLPFTNYDLEIYACTYAVGRALEKKDLLPDVNTAIVKARKIMERIHDQIDQLQDGHSWKDRLLAIYKGVNLFFTHNGGMTPADYIMMFKLFSEHVLNNR